MDLNSVTLSGRLTRDAVAKATQTGKGLIAFSLAVNLSKDDVAFIDVTYWTKTGETANKLVPYLTKGKQIGLTGYIKQDNWEDKTTGQKRSKLVVHCNVLQFMGSKEGGSAEEAADKAAPVTGEEVPF